MLSFVRFASVAALCCAVFGVLPPSTHCDTSYYEKYYSARRFVPPKRTSLLAFNFTVTLRRDEPLASYEQLALVGDLKALGAWRAADAILLNRTHEHNVWVGAVRLPANTSVSYRYFIAARDWDAAGVRRLQVRRWEAQLSARTFNTTTLAGNRTDTFGGEGAERVVQRGWLSAGRIVQLKLFHDPLRLNESRAGDEQLRVKVQPVEPHRLTAILPSARAATEYVRMAYGDSHLREQPEFGVPYRPQDILIFHTTVSELAAVAYQIKVYMGREGSELVRLVGYQYVYPEALQGSEGSFSIDLISPVWLNAIGSLELQYLVVAPLPNGPAAADAAAVDFRTTFVDYWRANWTALDVGHRGLGKSLMLASNAPPFVENTVASMKASGELGADLVEFDVMLTSDHIPIIAHDYVVHVCLISKTPRTKDDLTEVLIKDVTYEQLKKLKTYQIVGNKIVEYPAHNNVEDEDQRLFPSFEDFLTRVNKSLGFDIEIKWPQLKATGELESVQTIDKNAYVDSVLAVMLRHGCGRLSFFSSFDADICTMLRFKQNMYPVVFLSLGSKVHFADPRSDTIYDSVNNAQAFDLAGIAPNGVVIKSDPDWMQVAHKQNKKVFIWGDALKDASSIAWFKEQQPAGVIYDRFDLWRPDDKQNAFELESDLPDFFQMQCTPTTTPTKPNSGANSTADSVLSNVNFL